MAQEVVKDIIKGDCIYMEVWTCTCADQPVAFLWNPIQSFHRSTFKYADGMVAIQSHVFISHGLCWSQGAMFWWGWLSLPLLLYWKWICLPLDAVFFPAAHILPLQLTVCEGNRLRLIFALFVYAELPNQLIALSFPHWCVTTYFNTLFL